MPPRYIRFFASTLIILQLTIVWASLVAHRGTSRIQDDFLAYFDIYRTLGNWRMETNQIALASASDLSESIWIEWHIADTSESEWIAWPDQNRTASFGSLDRRQQRWLRQLADLIGLGITDGAGQMVASATRYRIGNAKQTVDRVRVVVSPSVPVDRFSDVEAAASIEDLPEDFRPQTVYEATLLSMADGSWSLLPKIENRRVSPAVKFGQGAKP